MRLTTHPAQANHEDYSTLHPRLPYSRSVELLVAIIMHEQQIGVRISSSLCAWYDVVNLGLFLSEETVSTHGADMVLLCGNAVLARR